LNDATQQYIDFINRRNATKKVLHDKIKKIIADNIKNEN
jgi:hypothetical protein